MFIIDCLELAMTVPGTAQTDRTVLFTVTRGNSGRTVQDAEAKIPEKTYKWLTFLYVNRYRKCTILIGQSEMAML